MSLSIHIPKILGAAASAALLGMLLAPSGSHAEDHPVGPAHWSYEGHDGPEHWATLDPKYATCSGGHSQSPINISDVQQSGLPPITFDYRKAAVDDVNNGHTVQFQLANGSAITVAGRRYELLQAHFHEPSEHTVNGKSYPAEVHFVHRDANGALAVVGVLIAEGTANRTLSTMWAYLPKAAGETQQGGKSSGFDPAGLLPKQREYYTYSGSLTTPPCTEGVTWLLMQQPITASKAQIRQFGELFAMHPTNRPVQPLNGRVVAR